jgi:hypothetical protein
MTTAGMLKSKLNNAKNAKQALKAMKSEKKLNTNSPGRKKTPPFTLSNGRNHGMTNKTSEIQNHNRRSVLNRFSVIFQKAGCSLT